ncbi:MAG: helix-turn-helix domain-containing protein [Nitrospirae bacterium]|nr:helix-turn-helix domain-containing protein [Nitrospirota bacterium]
MKKSKRAKLEAAGWAVGSVQDFLGLSDAETALIEMKLTLSRTLRDRRQRRGVSQVELAKRLRSSQSRVAKMEAGDPSVSMDLLVSSLLVLGASSADLARAIRALAWACLDRGRGGAPLPPVVHDPRARGYPLPFLMQGVMGAGGSLR